MQIPPMHPPPGDDDGGDERTDASPVVYVTLAVLALVGLGLIIAGFLM